ncbi:MAG TPA: hypothetical protein VHZ07_03345 [Bryobacteraceae bacterium]|jgi:hypothetical protein|nr:hypothetical protein [Bryobacteraceae bacterium]
MKFSVHLVLAVTGLAALCFASTHDSRWPVRDQETIQRTLTLSGEPMRLVVDNVEGYVHVRGVSGSKVEVTAHETIHAETESDLQQAKGEVKLEMNEKPGSVSIYYDAPWRCSGDCRGCCESHRRFYDVTYDIDVSVPRDARTVVSTVNNGDVRVDQLDGDFEVGNVNGGISMSGIGGSGDVHTVNGPITVRFVRSPSKPSSFKSVNGDLDAYFPQNLSADLLFKTFNGQIYSDFEVTAMPTPATGTERRDGKYIYRSNRFQGARAGHGGPELSFNTLNGNIRLHKEQ